jgi:indole-3-glycerol phosphate synthase
VEVHDVRELDVALDAGAGIVGVNNRNLRTLAVDTVASEAMAGRLPAGVIAVSESGLRSADDILRLRSFGYHAFLIGERFMTTPDPAEALRELLASVSAGTQRRGLPGTVQP